MPGFNRKGPESEGPMTGRKMGRCTAKDPDENTSRSERGRLHRHRDDSENAYGRGFGRGRGMGRAYGRNRND